jgi:hypothetical protein
MWLAEELPLLLGLACGATITVLAFVEAAFYGFCWCFGKLDNYFQDRYWENKKKTIFPKL